MEEGEKEKVKNTLLCDQAVCLQVHFPNNLKLNSQIVLLELLIFKELQLNIPSER